ncbi:MAG: hypothetical protein ABUT20_48255, partial [Bacteroidota bacterium]
MRKIAFGLVILLAACQAKTSSPAAAETIDTAQAPIQASSDAINAADAAAAMADSALNSTKNEHWSYSNDIDKMDNKKTYYAETSSTNSVEFSAPYDGGSYFRLIVRKSDKNEILLIASKGQFLSSFNASARIKFDDQKPMTIDFSEPNDGSANTIFLRQANTLISKLKKAKKVILECEFYQDGRKQIEFDVDGLKWD